MSWSLLSKNGNVFGILDCRKKINQGAEGYGYSESNALVTSAMMWIWTSALAVESYMMSVLRGAALSAETRAELEIAENIGST